MANDHNDCAEGWGITFAPDNRFDTSVMPRFDPSRPGCQFGGAASPARSADRCFKAEVLAERGAARVGRDPRS